MTSSLAIKIRDPVHNHVLKSDRTVCVCVCVRACEDVCV